MRALDSASENDGVGALQELETFVVAEAITATCAADLDGVSGSTTLVGAEVFGEALEAEPEPNTVIELVDDGEELTITLNRQVENADGSLSVTPLAVELAIEGTVVLALQVGPATCGVVEGVIPAEVVPAQPVPAEVTFTG